MATRKKEQVRPSKRRQTFSKALALLVVLSVVIVLSGQRIATFEAHAQEPVHLNHAPGPFKPLIDGSTDPASVSDNIAIHVLMQSLRMPQNPDSQAREQLRARIDRVGLSDADMLILETEVGKLDTKAREQQASIDALRPASQNASSAAITRFIEEQNSLSSLLVDHYEQLLASLSPGGRAKLQEHLIYVKSRIKVYPSPNMTATTHPSE